MRHKNTLRVYRFAFLLILALPTHAFAVPVPGYALTYCPIDCFIGAYPIDFASGNLIGPAQYAHSIAAESGGLAYKNDILYVGEGSVFSSYNLNNGESTIFQDQTIRGGSTGLDFVGDRLIGASASSNNNTLYIYDVNYATETTSDIFSVNAGFNQVGGLAAVNDGRFLFSAGQDYDDWGLYSFDLDTNTMDYIGRLAIELSAMDFGANGILYGLSSGQETIYQINPMDASIAALHDIAWPTNTYSEGYLFGLAIDDSIPMPVGSSFWLFLAGVFGFMYTLKYQKTESTHRTLQA